jgi:hypothetical protein
MAEQQLGANRENFGAHGLLAYLVEVAFSGEKATESSRLYISTRRASAPMKAHDDP